MNIYTSHSTKIETVLAVQDAYQQLINQADAPPSVLIVYQSVTHSAETIRTELVKLAPNIPIQGASSCLGSMTENGFHSEDGTGLAICGIWDETGAYGVGSSTILGDAKTAASDAILDAIANAGRYGEPPALIWLSGIPGYEEVILEGIQEVIGTAVPIAGGSSADNTVEGHWEQFTEKKSGTNQIVVMAMYPSVPTHFAFHSGYFPTDFRGKITKANGRLLQEIDGRPAAEVYNEWAGGIITEKMSGGNILADTTLNPLGRQVGVVGNQPYYRLAHPDEVTDTQALALFADVEVGDELVLMSGSIDSLVSRAGRVAKSAMKNGRVSAEQISGALVVYCAGCMLTVQNEMPQVVAGLNEALGENPFIGTFTFGEQGCFVGGENRHGNLMISVVVFEK